MVVAGGGGIQPKMPECVCWGSENRPISKDTSGQLCVLFACLRVLNYACSDQRNKTCSYSKRNVFFSVKSDLPNVIEGKTIQYLTVDCRFIIDAS